MAGQCSDFPKTMPTALPLGTVVGQKYRIDEVIAEGGMGVVYKGWHLILEHPIAIKVVRPELAQYPEAIARFIDEARASAQLQGIHSTHVLDIGIIDNGPPFMVLEYLEGRDLCQVLATDGPLPLTQAADYVLQTCEAVAEAHARRIVHRDLKPDNLFIQTMPDGTGILKVIDFGIAKRLGLDARPYMQRGQSCGSPDYMAPEQMNTPEQVDERADIWSIGVILFELLTNCVPFHSETVHSICVKVMTSEPIPLRSLRPDLPAEIEQIVQRCLSKQREGRYPNVGDLAQDLVPFASTEAAQSHERILRLLGEPETNAAPVGPMRALSRSSPLARDATPLRTANATQDVLPRVPMLPLWPAALGVATAALALVLSISDSRTLRVVALTAAGQAESVARTGARVVGAMALAATSYIESETVGAERRPEPISMPASSAGATTGPEAVAPGQPVESLPLVCPSAPDAPAAPSL